MPKLVLYVILVPIILVIAAALLLPVFVDKDTVLELATDQLKQQTGATLTVAGESSLSFFPSLGLTLTDAGLAMPGEEQPSLSVRSLDIGVQLMPLLSGRAEMNSIALDGVTLRIESGEKSQTIDTSELSNEELNAFYAKRRRNRDEAGAAAGAAQAVALPLALNVQQLTITDSRIEQVDTKTNTTTVIELASLEATGLNLSANPMELSAQLKLPGQSPLLIALEGMIRVDQKTQKVMLDDLEIVLTGATAQPLSLQTNGDIDISSQVAELELSLASGETRGDGKLRYASFESPAIDARLHLNRLSPALLALAGPEAATTSGGEATSGDDPLPLDAIRNIDTRADITVDKAVFDAHTISGLRGKLRMREGVIKLNSLTGMLHGGKLDMQAIFNGKHNTATLKTSGQWGKLDIATALAATAAQAAITGSASLDWKLTSKGGSSNELMTGMTGPIKLTTNQVVLDGISVEHMLCQAVALTNQESLTATFAPNTRFETLSADIKLANGKAILRPLRADLPHVKLTGKGSYQLLSKDFKTTFKARLSPQLETLDRACRVSKRLTAIDWPVTCAGNADGEPGKWCSVDTAEIVEDLGKNEAKRKLQKEAGKLLDKLFK